MQDKLIIIQATCIYDSIPGRAFLKLGDGTDIIGYIIGRLKGCGGNICIATSDRTEDDVFAKAGK